MQTGWDKINLIRYALELPMVMPELRYMAVFESSFARLTGRSMVWPDGKSLSTIPMAE